jgi:hypothetical protein
MDRTMVSLLGDPSPTPRQLRLSGQHRFLWDRIAFGPSPEFVDLGDGSGRASLRNGGDLVARVAVPMRAELGYHGFSPMVGNRSRHEQTYDYAGARPDDSYESAWGQATRYGDVLALLTAHDDELVVLVAGDRVLLEFQLPEELGSEDGRGRTYFLRISGWAKEGSFHNTTGRWIEPLPFRAMNGYPPASPRATDAAYVEYLDTYQTRALRFE